MTAQSAGWVRRSKRWTTGSRDNLLSWGYCVYSRYFWIFLTANQSVEGFWEWIINSTTNRPSVERNVKGNARGQMSRSFSALSNIQDRVWNIPDRQCFSTFPNWPRRKLKIRGTAEFFFWRTSRRLETVLSVWYTASRRTKVEEKTYKKS